MMVNIIYDSAGNLFKIETIWDLGLNEVFIITPI